MNMISGSCGCGKVKYKIHSAINNIVNSHCNMCKKLEGVPSSTYAALPIQSMEITQGKEHVHSYKICLKQKYFCGSCGMTVYETNRKLADIAMITLRTLNPIHHNKPHANVWCECIV